MKKDIFDGHVDVADMYKEFKLTKKDFYNSDSDAPITYQKMLDSNIKIINLTLYYDENFVTTNLYDGVKSYLDFYDDLLEKDKFRAILKGSDIDKVGDKIGYFHSIEGMDCLRSPNDFDEFYDRGVRMFTMTWDNSNIFATGIMDDNDKGITKLGLEVLKKAEKRKVIMDISHLSRGSIDDLQNNFNGMIVRSHGNVKRVWDAKRSVTDDEIQMIVDRKGVVGLLPLVSSTGPKGTFEELYKHFEYIVSKWGNDYVTFSSDIYPLPEYPFLEGHKDIKIMKALQDFLLTKLSEENVYKVMFQNWERVIRSSL